VCDRGRWQWQRKGLVGTGWKKELFSGETSGWPEKLRKKLRKIDGSCCPRSDEGPTKKERQRGERREVMGV
jgi:hypothetical protein